MKRISSILSVVVTAGFMLFGAQSALADDCTDPAPNGLNGTVVAGVCQVSSSVNASDAAHGGAYNIPESLRICGPGGLCAAVGTGIITVPPSGNTLTINITGDLTMEAGSKIVGDAPGATGLGADITIQVTGNILLAGGTPGAMITANQVVSKNGGSCSGGHSGDITLTSTGGGNITTEVGSVIAAGQIDLGTNTSKCPAGEIIITTSGKGEVDIDGSVLSQSSQTGTGLNGGGPITIVGGCNLVVSDTGVVSSRGLDPGADLVHIEACTVQILGLVESTGSGHALPNAGNRCNDDNFVAHPIGPRSQFFTGCVEVWSGTTLTILNDNAGNNGEINADIGGPGGNQGRGWIDLFARGDISITGIAKYAVHSNGGNGQNTDDGGLITVKSSGGKVTTAALAIQANSLTAGGLGGNVLVEASQNIEFGTASIQAKGNTGGASGGGHITARSSTGAINGAAGGELNAFGSGSGGTGTVNLTACTANPGPPDDTYKGTVTGTETDTKACTSDPVIPAGVPAGDCKTQCNGGDGNCEKATVTSVLNPLTGRFPGNHGPDTVVRLDLGQTVQAAVNAASDLNSDGYIILLVVKDGTGVLGGSTTENVVISQAYDPRFALLACSVTIKAKDNSLAAGHITTTASSPAGSPENIFVMDLHGTGSKLAGWLVEGNGRYMRNVATSTSGVGMWIIGDNNTMHNGNGNNNNPGAGILVHGNNNIVDSSDAVGNKGNGVTVEGNGNQILKVDAGDKGKGNGGDGVNVTGNNNTISEVDAYANTGNGINVVTGNGNQLLKNNAGDSKKGNSKNGILLSGDSNNLQENDAYANGIWGIKASGGVNTYTKNNAGDRGDKANKVGGFLLSGGGGLTENTAIGNLGTAPTDGGFHLQTSGFTLSKNVSGGTGSGYANADCQYRFDLAGNVNGGGNKSNNVTLVGSPFPAGCIN